MVVKGSYSMAHGTFVCILGGAKTGRREIVQLRGGALPKIKLSSPNSVPVGTRVTIQSGRHRAQGIVEQCETGHFQFEMTVEIQRGGEWLMDLIPVPKYYDPGVHSVNKFISDEDLVQLMNELAPKVHIVGSTKVI